VVTFVVALLGCGVPAGVEVRDQVLPVACGSCVLGVEGPGGCYWAVEFDGQVYPVGGVHPSDDMVEAHGPEGMCSVERQARIDGNLRPDGRFVATRFELLPYDGEGRKGHDHAKHR
jgi:hypothetical protein